MNATLNSFIIFTILIILAIVMSSLVECTEKSSHDKPSWTKKDIRDYNDADIERLYDQWEEREEPLEPDELPEHLRESPKIDLSKIDMSDPEGLLRLSKKGKTLMSFVTVSGDPTRDQTEKITALWQSSLMNSHIIADRFIISDNRAIFMFKDGAQAWDAKQFLVEQESMEEITIENKPYYGKYSTKAKQEL